MRSDRSVRRGGDTSFSKQGSKATGFKPPAQFHKAGAEQEPLRCSHAGVAPFASAVQRKESESINGISHSENEAVRQLTGGAVDLHASGAKAENTTPSDSRLKNVGARSMAVGGQAIIGDNRDRGHEIWHLAQQQQGRVQPTTSVNSQAVNDDPGLEKEADVMGAKIMQGKWIDAPRFLP